jgi:translation initiation factor 2B subunit (eIF-2B alpha/beta/delta family)
VDPLLALFVDVWWIAPVTVGAGALGWVGLRGQRSAGARRLELDAARHDVRKAHEAVTRRRAEVAVAHAELVRTQSERTTHRATEREVAAARRALQNARQTARSASAALRARRESLRAARATVPHVGTDPAEFPLARVVAAHNVVLARWMEYETDPAKLIAFPAMSDGRSPVMTAFLREQQQAQWLRPASADSRMAPADFAAYRDAVRRLERAFDSAEHEAIRQASGRSAPDSGSDRLGNWADTAQELLWNAQRALAWSAEAKTRDGAWPWQMHARRTKPPAS